MIPLAIIFLRHSPAEIGSSPSGRRAAAAAPPRANPFRIAIGTLREFAPRRDFQLLVFAFFVCGATTNGLIGTHLIAACADHGFTEVQGAGLLAAIGVFDIVGTITLGLADRPLRPALAAVLVLRPARHLAAGPQRGAQLGGRRPRAFVIFDGLDWVATVPPTIALCRKIAGPERVGVVFAWVFCSHQLGAAFAAWGAGFTRSWLGHLRAAFLISGALGVAAAMVSLLIGRRIVRPCSPDPALARLGTSSSAIGAGDDSLRTVANTAAITSAAPITAETPRLSSRMTAPSNTATAGLTYWWLTTVEIGRCCSAQT